MNGLRPVKYIGDVLRKLASGEMDYMALLPMNIVSSQKMAIDCNLYLRCEQKF